VDVLRTLVGFFVDDGADGCARLFGGADLEAFGGFDQSFEKGIVGWFEDAGARTGGAFLSGVTKR